MKVLKMTVLEPPAEGPETFKCRCCGQDTDKLEEFPGRRCLACYMPDGERMAATMTAEKLTAMWGGQVLELPASHLPACDPHCEDWPLCRHREEAPAAPWTDPRDETGCYCPGDCACHHPHRLTVCGCTGRH